MSNPFDHPAGSARMGAFGNVVLQVGGKPEDATSRLDDQAKTAGTTLNQLDDEGTRLSELLEAIGADLIKPIGFAFSSDGVHRPKAGVVVVINVHTVAKLRKVLRDYVETAVDDRVESAVD